MNKWKPIEELPDVDNEMYLGWFGKDDIWVFRREYGRYWGDHHSSGHGTEKDKPKYFMELPGGPEEHE
jgi:hypothetical protein